MEEQGLMIIMTEIGYRVLLDLLFPSLNTLGKSARQARDQGVLRQSHTFPSVLDRTNFT